MGGAYNRFLSGVVVVVVLLGVTCFVGSSVVVELLTVFALLSKEKSSGTPQFRRGPPRLGESP